MNKPDLHSPYNNLRFCLGDNFLLIMTAEVVVGETLWLAVRVAGQLLFRWVHKWKVLKVVSVIWVEVSQYILGTSVQGERQRFKDS
jgi:hypothetical protein